MPASKKRSRKRTMKVNIELTIFLALLVAIAGAFLIAQDTTSITGAVVSTLPVEEQAGLFPVPEPDSDASDSSAELIIEPPVEAEEQEDSSLGIQQISIQNIPTITVVLNTTNISTNDTNTNLTAYNTTQTNGTSLKVIWNWIKNGTSFAMLNMPFEGINGTTTDNAWDYSGYRNNASDQGGIVWNATGGHDNKGAYNFDGTNDYLRGDLPSNGADENITITAWVRPDTVGSAGQTGFNKGQSGNCFGYGMTIYSGGVLRTRVHAGDFSLGGATIVANDWNFLAIVYNKSGAFGYVNGTFVGENSSNSIAACSVTNYTLGIRAGAGSEVFDGHIDDLMVFNRSLSAEQIFALWQNKTNVIVSNETIKNENWAVVATPNNGTGDGLIEISSNVTILNAKPIITPPLILNTTNTSSNSTNLNLTAYANTSDVDGDSVKVIYNWLRDNKPIAVLNMPFEGINGTTYNNSWDYSGYGHHGHTNGSFWNATGGFDGKGAYTFDGIRNYTNLTNAATLTTLGNRAIVFWMKPTGVQAAGNGFVLGKDEPSRRDYDIGFQNGKLYAEIYNSSGQNEITAASLPTVTAGTWTHIAYVANSTNHLFYKNGVLANSQVRGPPPTSSLSELNIGRRTWPGANSYFNGSVDELMIFNYSLSAEQVFAIYQNKTNTTVAQETTVRGENWTVQGTPN